MRAALLFLAVCAGCGDPLIGSSFTGTPLFSLGGVVVQPIMRVPSSHGPLELSLFWIGGQDATDARVEQHARLDSGFSEYAMTLFDPPPDGARGFTDLMADGSLAIGVIVLYADVDASGDLDLTKDLLLGASAEHVVVYASRSVAAGSPAAELVGSLDAGYHVFTHDQPSHCHFVDAARCPAEGHLIPTEVGSSVALTLWGAPADVVVPAPAARGNSIWTARPE